VLGSMMTEALISLKRQTDAGSSLHEEGEENEKTNDDFQPGGNIDRDRDGRPDGDGGDREGPARGSRSSSATLLAELRI
jgi:hypothetical protein